MPPARVLSRSLEKSSDEEGFRRPVYSRTNSHERSRPRTFSPIRPLATECLSSETIWPRQEITKIARRFDWKKTPVWQVADTVPQMFLRRRPRSSRKKATIGRLKRHFRLSTRPQGFEIICDVILQRTAPGTASMFVGIEAVINFLAPSAPDRYFETHGQRYPLRWGACDTRVRVANGG